MARFTTRVELHSATYSDYDKLHSEMEKRGFSRRIQGSDDVWYHLPTAEYNYSGSDTAAEVRDKACSAADATGRESAVLVSEATTRVWKGLVRVK